MRKTGNLIIPLTAIFLPVCIYLLYAWFNAAPLFYADDFHLLKTIVWMQEADTVGEKLGLLLQQHNEHRILFPRLITWLDYQIEGSINWKTLIVFGNLLWVAVLWFIWKGFRSFNLPVWIFIPVPWMLLQPQYYDNVTWTISILQQSVIIFWFGLFCYLIAKNRFSWALLVAVVATFTHGNGIFSFFIGILFLLLDRRWRTALGWGMVWVLIGIIYFWHFQKGQNSDFARSLSDPVRLLMAFFAFFGAAMIRMGAHFAVVSGFLCVLVLGIFLMPRLRLAILHKKPLSFFEKLVTANVVFLGITAALICVSRSWGGIENVMAPRYQHYSPYVICWAYVVLIAVLGVPARRIFAAFSLAASLLFNGLCYLEYTREVTFRKHWLTADESNWKNHHVFLNYQRSLNRNIFETYTSAVNKGICISGDPFAYVVQPDAPTDTSFHFQFVSTVAEYKEASGNYFSNNLKILNEEIVGSTYLYLQPKEGQGYWLPTRQVYGGVRRFLRTGNAYRPGFELEFMKENLPGGNYRIAVLNNGKLSWTREEISIENQVP